MNLREALDAEHSKAQTVKITTHIGDSRKRFRELVTILTGDDRRLTQRAAWVVSHCAKAHPGMVQPFLGELIENLRRPDLHDAVKRNTMKAVSELEVPVECAGLAANIAFEFLSSPDEAVAVKAHSMSVLERLCQREPALADELRLVIEHLLPIETKAAFQARARHVLRALDRKAAVD